MRKNRLEWPLKNKKDISSDINKGNLCKRKKWKKMIKKEIFDVIESDVKNPQVLRIQEIKLN